jgi:hypothetical protein
VGLTVGNPTRAGRLIQDAQTRLHTVELKGAPLSTPLTALITQAETDLATLVKDLDNPSDLATAVRHFAADLETLSSVFADVAANAKL